VSPANGYGDHITVGDGTSTVAGQNFTDAAVASGASISGSVTAGGAGLGNVTVYLDANNNGVLDSSEMSTTTSASGVYQFTNVPAGAYIVRQVLAAGQTQVSPGSGYGIHLTVQSNSSYSGENFVDASGSAGISGTVFNDANGNGVNDDNDGGVAGLTVYLDLNNSGAPTSNDPTTTTDSSGNYSFTGLAAGSYIVRVVAASGYHQTTPSNNYGQHVTVSAGQPDVGVNFGEQAVNLDTFTQISWQTAAPGPIIRAEALRASVNGLLYVFGGFNGNNGPVLRSDVYNPATNSWSEIANLPERLTHAGVAVYGNLVYFVGGYVGIPNETGFAQIFGTSDVWIYNTTTNTFSAGPSLPAQYAGGGAVIVGNMLHFFGGFDINRNDVNIHLVLNLADPSAGWSALAPIPYSVNHMGYVNYDGLIYAIDGQTGYDAGLTTQDYVQIYDPTTNTWTQGAPCPVSRSHIANATFVMGDRIIFLGGEEANEVETAGVYAYTPSTNTWTQLTSLPSALFSGVGAEINGLIYFTSGGNTTTTYVGTPL
jgi:N-acetylneuraminic acid mutarotase